MAATVAQLLASQHSLDLPGGAAWAAVRPQAQRKLLLGLAISAAYRSGREHSPSY